jgi:hypothetical protein
LSLLRLFKFVRERIALFLHGAQSLGHGELARDLAGIESGLQFLDLGSPWPRRILQFAGDLGLASSTALRLSCSASSSRSCNCCSKSAVANLLQDVRVARPRQS